MSWPKFQYVSPLLSYGFFPKGYLFVIENVFSHKILPLTILGMTNGVYKE